MSDVALDPSLVRLADIVTHASLLLAQPEAGQGGPKKYTRSRRGCLTCRSRKVKCDEVHTLKSGPRCLRCAGMGRDCLWDADEPKERPKKRSKSAAEGEAGPSTAKSVSGSSTASTPPDPLAPTAPSAGVHTAPNPHSLTDRHGIVPTLLAQTPMVTTQPIQPLAAAPPAPARAAAAAAAAGPSFPRELARAHAHAHLLATSAPAPAPLQPPALSPFSPLLDAVAETYNNATLAPSPNFDMYLHDLTVTPPDPGSAWGLSPATIALLAEPADSSRVAPVLSDDEEEDAAATVAGDRGKRKHDDVASSPDFWVQMQRQLAQDTPVASGSGVGALDDLDVERDTAIIELDRTPTNQLVSRARPVVRAMNTTPRDNDVSHLTLAKGSIAARRASAFGGHAPPPLSMYEPVRGPMPALDPFMHAFPTASARGLFKHYVDNTSGIVTAMGRTKPGQNPFLAVSLPLILTDTASPACAALRFSLLTTSAAHILHLRGGEAADVAALCDRLKRLAIGYTVMSQASEREADGDLVLAACVILTTRDVLSADRGWRSNLDFAISCVRKRGGPEKLMARDPSFTKRFVLEQIVTHEVFSCFTTGGEPTLLTPYAPWWFDVEKSSGSAWQWESVENLFGISRAMVEIIARICSLVAKKNRLGKSVRLDEPELAPVKAYLESEAEALIQELEIFGVTLRSLPLHRRVQYGDHIYRMAMTLHLFTEIHNYDVEHARVRAIAPAVLELCSEISMQPVMLVWPLLIVARSATVDERDWIRLLLNTYSDQYCRDLQTAEELIYEYWDRKDAGEEPYSWSTLMEETDKMVLLI